MLKWSITLTWQTVASVKKNTFNIKNEEKKTGHLNAMPFVMDLQTVYPIYKRSMRIASFE